MKIGGKQPIRPKGEVYRVYRKDENGEDLIYEFKVSPVFDFTKREEIDPLPSVPTKKILRPQPRTVPDVNNPAYQKALQAYYERTTAWQNLMSLRDTEIEWASVDMEKPETWKNWIDDLRTFMLESEIVELLQTIRLVNNPSMRTSEDAFKAFTEGMSETSDS